MLFALSEEIPMFRTVPSHPRRAFTLVELLVVIAIIGTLVGLLLPAVQAAREAANRSSCNNKLKQIGLAFQNYHSSRNSLPASDYNAGGDWGTWQVAILPFMEENALYDRYQGFMRGTAPGSTTVTNYNHVNNRPVTTTLIPQLLCPSDASDENTRSPNFFNITKHNYVVNAGNTNRMQDFPGRGTPLNGVIYGGAPFIRHGKNPVNNVNGRLVKFSNIPDGLSKTMMASETCLGINPTVTTSDLRGFTWWGPGAVFHAFNGPNSPTPDQFQFASYCNNQPAKNLPCIQASEVQLAARSRHPGGVNVANCDGSIRFVSNDVDIAIWRAAATAEFGESLSLD
jgi:prepilin-type N-terminal cleavage/methylation domain-containing protein